MKTYAERKRANPEWAARERERLRRKRHRAAPTPPVEADTLTPADMHILMEAFGWRTCAYCRATVGREGITWDHVVPLRAGAGLTPHNAVPACRPCNSSKQDGDLREWMTAKGYDLPAFEASWAAALERIGPQAERPAYDWRALQDARARRFACKPENRLGRQGRMQGPPRPCRYLCGQATHGNGLCVEHYARDQYARKCMDSGHRPRWIIRNDILESVAAGVVPLMSRLTIRRYRQRAGLPSLQELRTPRVDPNRPLCSECGRKNATMVGRCSACYCRRRSAMIKAGQWRGRP